MSFSANNNIVIIFLYILLGVYTVILLTMSKRDDKRIASKIDEQNKLSEILLAVIPSVSAAGLGLSETIFGVVRKIYRTHPFFFIACLLLVIFSMFSVITSRWFTTENIKPKEGITQAENARQKKSKYNTAGIALSMIAAAGFVLLITAAY